MVMLVSNKTPMYVQDRLNSFLRPEIHDYFEASVRYPVKTRILNHADMKMATPAKVRVRAASA
jgi:hypothetical protein